MVLHKIHWVALIMIMATSSAPARGDIVTFTDRPTFNTATMGLGSASNETFDAFTMDTMISNNSGSPTPFVGFDAYHTGAGGLTPGFLVQSVDVAPFTAGGAFAIDATPYLVVFAAELGNDPNPAVESQSFLLPNVGTRAIGFDYKQWGDGTNDTELQVTTTAGNFSIPNPALSDGFLGLQVTGANETIQSMTWVATAGSLRFDAIGIDAVSAVAIPEPGAFWISAIALGLFASKRRRTNG